MQNTLFHSCAGTFGRMESNTTALVKILDSLEKQERMVKAMLEDRKRQLKGKGRSQPSLEQLTASAAQVQHHDTDPVILAASLQHLSRMKSRNRLSFERYFVLTTMSGRGNGTQTQ